MRIAINGFGRIGRNIARHLLSNDDFKDIELVAVNDLGSIDANAHLLKYDSVHGILDKDIAVNSEKALISEIKGQVENDKNETLGSNLVY